MFQVERDGKIQIEIGDFILSDYILSDVLELAEDFTSAILQNLPPCLWIETSNNSYYIVCNMNQCYILDLTKMKMSIQSVTLLEVCNGLYTDIYKYKKNIMKIQNDLQISDINEIITVNLETLLVCKNTIINDFEFKKGNIIQKTLETLNYALYLHSAGLVYDIIEETEFFRIYDYDKIYIIEVKKIKEKTKAILHIINKPLEKVSVEIYENLKNKKKLKHTNNLLDTLKNNLIEYGIHL